MFGPAEHFSFRLHEWYALIVCLSVAVVAIVACTMEIIVVAVVIVVNAVVRGFLTGGRTSSGVVDGCPMPVVVAAAAAPALVCRNAAPEVSPISIRCRSGRRGSRQSWQSS